MWIDLVGRLSSSCKAGPPASPAKITEAEVALRVALPKSFNDLLCEADGIEVNDGICLIWPVERILKDNLKFRTSDDFRSIYMPFDPLLFFGDAGNGDQFAFVIVDGQIRRDDVFTWNHEDDSRVWAAPGLREYIEWWLSGRIST